MCFAERELGVAALVQAGAVVAGRIGECRPGRQHVAVGRTGRTTRSAVRRLGRWPRAPATGTRGRGRARAGLGAVPFAAMTFPAHLDHEAVPTDPQYPFNAKDSTR